MERSGFPETKSAKLNEVSEAKQRTKNIFRTKLFWTTQL